MKRPLELRPARVEDAETLARLVQELNAHQRDPTDRFDAESVRRDAFGVPARYEALLAESEGKAVGYALFLPAFETGWAVPGLYLQDLYVTAEARGHGVGQALLAEVAAIAKRRGTRFVWWASKDWNTEAHAFFRRFATVEERVIAFAAYGGEFDRLVALAEERVRGHGA